MNKKLASAKAKLAKKLNVKFSDENGRNEFTTESGATIFVVALEQGNEVYDGGNNLLVNTEFTIGDKVYSTDENGKITAITDKLEDTSEIEFSDEETAVIQEIIDEVKEEAETLIEDKDAKIKELEAKIAELEEKLKSSNSENIQLKANKKAVKTEFKREDKPAKGFLASVNRALGM